MSAVTGQATAVKVIYYNMMGMSSSRPWPGLNIECRAMSDGTTLSRKVLLP